MTTTETPNTPAADDIDALERSIIEHNYHYWVRAQPIISDYAYDALVERLRAKAPESPVLVAVGTGGAMDAPELRARIEDVIARFPPPEDLEQGEKIEHDVAMLSLDKCYDEENLRKWFEKFEGAVLVSPKIDGVAASFKYRDGKLVLAVTRGDGKRGELMTENARQIVDLPLEVNAGAIEVRGEAYMPLHIFDADYAGEFANPRNLTAGALKQKDVAKTAAYRIHFFAYDLIGEDHQTESAKFARLRELGFQTVETQRVEEADLQTAYDAILAKRGSFDYDTDGVVYKADDVSEQQRMGANSHHPRYAIAYKFQGDSGTSVLRDVEWSVSRTGSINPVAIILPVRLSGATITRASLHNLSIMEALAKSAPRSGRKTTTWRGFAAGGYDRRSGYSNRAGVHRARPWEWAWETTRRDAVTWSSAPRVASNAGQPSELTLVSKVVVMRRGGVIPHIEAVAKQGYNPVRIPTVCPDCGAPTRRSDKGDTLIADHTTDCRTYQLKQLEHYVSVVKIDNLGEKILAQIYDNRLARTKPELYALTAEQLLPLERMGETLARKLVANIQQRRQLDADVFLRALAIDELGRHVSAIMAEHFPSMDAILALEPEQLSSIHTIGDTIAKTVVAGLKQKRPLIEALLREVELSWPADALGTGDEASVAGPLMGVTVLFTGALASMNRKEAQNKVLAAGGELASGVSKRLNLLVLGDKDMPRYNEGWRSSKLKKAEKYIKEGAALEVISEADFLARLDGDATPAEGDADDTSG